MKTIKLIVSLRIEVADDATIPPQAKKRLEMNIEGVVTGTLQSLGVNPSDVLADVRDETEA